ncbi:MAG: hypothetical protein WBE28_04940 [bacterium]
MKIAECYLVDKTHEFHKMNLVMDLIFVFKQCISGMQILYDSMRLDFLSILIIRKQ